MGKAVLIFPAGMPLSLDFLEKAQAECQRVIGASSLDVDPMRDRYPSWVTLPYVTQPEFDEALTKAIREHDIGSIYTPHPVVWAYLSEELERVAPGVTLTSAAPLDLELKRYRTARKLAQEFVSKPLFGRRGPGGQTAPKRDGGYFPLCSYGGHPRYVRPREDARALRHLASLPGGRRR